MKDKNKKDPILNKDKDGRRKLVLLDSHAIIHRAYHALPEFMNSRGEPTGAIYGLATMLFKIITELKPDYIVACFDLPKKTFRHEAYEDYKGKRAKADEALVAQLISSRAFFKALFIPMYECEGFEADDLLGTIAEKNKENKNLEIVIASGDMDTLQLVEDKRVFVYTLKKGINDTILYDIEKVKSRFGFLPIYLPDYKGLRGDPSDNIIGIKGIGEKTASTLIGEFGSIEKMYEVIKNNEDKIRKLGITERVLNLLKEGEDEALFSKTLATIRRDAPISFQLPEHKWKDEVKKEDVAKFFRDMEFKSLQNRFLNVLDGNLAPTKENSSSEDLQTRQEKVETSPQKTSFDMSETETIKKIQIAFWLLNSEKTNTEIQEILETENNQNLHEVLKNLEDRIEKEKLDYVYRNIEIPIISIIEEMETNGILVDLVYLKSLSKLYHHDLSKLEKEIWEIAGMEFNINSPKQMGDVLFSKMNLPLKGLKKSAGGAISTRESELEKLRDGNPVIGKILEYRELQKLLSTYIDTIGELVGKDGRLHATFLQAGTTTGRFSSNNPNLQNIPVKTERGKNIRNAFIAPPGYSLVSFDYSQIELRVAALLSQDSYFLNVFNEGKDIHQAVAIKVFKVEEGGVTAEMRRRAKVINFGILYGMGVNALKQNLGTDRKEAQIFYDNYFAQFPTIGAYLESIKNFAKQNGYTETLFGRKRYFPGIKSPVPFIKAMAERMAVNAPIQGTATADIIKIGMKRVDEELIKADMKKYTRLILQVHDELIYEIKEEKVKEICPIIEKAMKDVIPNEFLKDIKSVPLLVSCDIGHNWGVLK